MVLSEYYVLLCASFLELGRQCEQTTCPMLLPSTIVAGVVHESGPLCLKASALITTPQSPVHTEPAWSITRLLPGQFFPECHPLVGFSFAEVPAGYVLWCRCTAELHVLNDEYTRQWHLMMHIIWWDNLSVAANVLMWVVLYDFEPAQCSWVAVPTNPTGSVLARSWKSSS